MGTFSPLLSMGETSRVPKGYSPFETPSASRAVALVIDPTSPPACSVGRVAVASAILSIETDSVVGFAPAE